MPVITISRQIGSGGRMLAEQLAAALDYRLVDKVLLTRAAQLAGVSEERFAEFESQGQEGLIERLLRSVARGLPNLDHYYRAFAEMESEGLETAEYAYYGHTHHGHERLRREDVVKYFEATIREMSQRGNVIILGRGGQVVLADSPHTLHVRVSGNSEARIGRVAERQGISLEEAGRLVQADDSKRLGYLRENYDRDSNDVQLYDVTFRLDSIDPAVAVDFVRQWAIEESKRQHQPFEKQA